MDGKITALNVNNGGTVLYSVDTDTEPLLSGTFSAQQKVFKLIFVFFFFFLLMF